MDAFFKAFKDKFRRGGQTKKQFGGSSSLKEAKLKAKKKHVEPVNGEVKGEKKTKKDSVVTKDKSKSIIKKYGGSRK